MKLRNALFILLFSISTNTELALGLDDNIISRPILNAGVNKIVHVRLDATSGIGNRIKKIISYMRYYSPKHINLYWEKEDWVTASFFSLFSPKWDTSVTEYNSEIMINNFKYNEPLTEYISEYSLLVTAKDFPNAPIQRIDALYNKTPENLKKIYLPYFENLHPSAQVAARINSVTLPENTVAVQIRNAADWEKSGKKNIPLDKFFKAMDTYPADTYFFISTMSKEVSTPFHQRYGNRIIELPNKDYNSMIDATADMYLLGRTKEAIYSYGSTFPEVGWWLGGGKSKVRIIGAEGKGLSPYKEILRIPPDVAHF